MRITYIAWEEILGISPGSRRCLNLCGTSEVRVASSEARVAMLQAWDNIGGCRGASR